ncbi:hypothetical protein J3R30DRAFT_3702205 [Lentinula aciculospora]|uniref:RRM domain-containing protein n=1 Tax=Lentinula aciculospora TaxID=153920 RepID=A0A9W9DPA9_9AGAR|nr:hypothetical protein J3R30DRAFT_3702205 [Lentinula aciculospora]
MASSTEPLPLFYGNSRSRHHHLAPFDHILLFPHIYNLQDFIRAQFSLFCRQADEDFINKSLLEQLDAEPIISSSSLSDSSTSDHQLSSSSNPNSSPESSPVIQIMRQQPPRPNSPSEQFGMYTDFEPDKRSTLNGYHRSSFNAIPNATRSTKHHVMPSSTLPSTNPTIYRDAGEPVYQLEAYSLTSPTQSHMQPSFVDRSNYAAPFSLAEPYTNYRKLLQPSQTHTVNSHSVPMSSQTPYGPHLAANNIPMGANSGHGSGGGNAISGGGSNMQEDISTIFVVGFPDDMQEREFQNMFTFSAGFEAATLKIPNKEYTAYGIPGSANSVTASSGLQGLNPSLASIVRAQAAVNDPYNLVTLNQGGVVVDGGRDGTMSSWPTAPVDDSYYPPGLGIGGLGTGVGGPGITLGPNPNPSTSSTAGASLPGNVPPRKQIIGFAKFRTREEALEARDVLQGRRVDIEKGAVLKAEMAKKNLHTKRGVTANGAGTNGGPVNGNSAGANPLSVGHLGPALLAASNGIGFSGNVPLSHYDLYPSSSAHLAELGSGNISIRDRELGTLGAMGFTSAVPSNNTSSSGTTVVPGSLSNIWDEDSREREHKVYDAMGLGISSGDESSGLISAKEGGRRRMESKNDNRERDEKQPLRLRSGSAFDAFHSVPASSSIPENGVVSPPLRKARPLALSSLTHDERVPGPWNHFSKSSAGSNVPNSASSKASHSSSNGHSRSSRSSSVAAGSTHSKHSVREVHDDEDVHTNPEMALEDPNATAKGIDVAEIARAVGSLAVATNNHANGNAGSASMNMNLVHSQGYISPQLPSPSSGSGTSVSALSAGGASGNSASAAISSSSSSSSGMRHVPAPAQHCSTSNFASQTPASNLNISHLSSMLSSTLPGLVSGVDQNPPINTLYVGNLPISPPPLGYPPDILEESLRELFRTRPGYKRISYKQKSTGPMCFVEFEDVNAATRTINELYGNTLNGLVKGGGIRLSYSKNPLGIRTPTSANGSGPGYQQQHFQQHSQTGRDGDRDRGDRYAYGGTQALSPTPHHHSVNHRPAQTHEFMISPPPPRFAGNSNGVNSNMSFGNFSSSSFNGVPVGSGTNVMFGSTNSFQGGVGPGVGYRLASSDPYGDAQGGHMSFSPFDNGHLDHPQLPPIHSIPMQHQGPNPNQNQNF